MADEEPAGPGHLGEYTCPLAHIDVKARSEKCKLEQRGKFSKSDYPRGAGNWNENVTIGGNGFKLQGNIPTDFSAEGMVINGKCGIQGR